jgi:hypothetical protein
MNLISILIKKIVLYVSDCYEYFGKNNCYGFDTGYSMSEPGYNSDEELEKIKGEVKSINDNKIDSILHDGEYKEMDIKEHSDYKGEGLYT